MDAKRLAKQTNVLVLMVVVIYLVSQLVILLTLGEDWVNRNLYLFLAFIQLFIILLPALLFVNRQGLKSAIASRCSMISFPQAILIVLMSGICIYIASVLNLLVAFLLEKIGPVTMDSVPVPETISELWLQIVVIALLPAFCEEFFFRGILFNSFEGLGVKKAIVVSAAYFALFHFDIRNLAGPFFLGMMIAWYCYRTGSLFAGVLAHFSNNLMAVLLSWFGRNESNEPVPLTEDMMGSILMLACLLGAFLLIVMKAFISITNKRIKALPTVERSLSLTVMLQWPVWIFYAVYLTITALFMLSLQFSPG